MFTEYMSWPEACAATGLTEDELRKKLYQHTSDSVLVKQDGSDITEEDMNYGGFYRYMSITPHYKHNRRRNFSVYKNYQILYGDAVKSLSECPICMKEK